MVRAQICMSTVVDDWEKGEDPQTFQIDELETTTFKDTAEAVKYFKDNYGWYVDKPVFEVCDDFICIDFSGVPTEYSWRALKDEEVELWKQGKLKVWNIEFQLKLWKLVPLEEKELESALAEA